MTDENKYLESCRKEIKKGFHFFYGGIMEKCIRLDRVHADFRDSIMAKLVAEFPQYEMIPIRDTGIWVYCSLQTEIEQAFKSVRLGDGIIFVELRKRVAPIVEALRVEFPRHSFNPRENKTDLDEIFVIYPKI